MSPPVGDPKDATRPPPDKVFDDIADYVHNFKIDSDLAMNTARLCLMDTIGCVSVPGISAETVMLYRG